jgi:hypothetical protein
MATVYKIELVSDWVSYTAEQIQEIIELGFKKYEHDEHSNQIHIEIERL